MSGSVPKPSSSRRFRRLLDLLTVANPDLTRDDLYARVLCGEVRVNGERIRDPGLPVPVDARVEIVESGFVSRGGDKLEGALAALGLSVRGLVMLDAGASTGGFTDCLLRRGARVVHAVDVGSGQLHPRLASDGRVVVHDRSNVMKLEYLDPRPEAAVCDLSFRSLRGALSRIRGLAGNGWVLALVKPQFELRKAPREFRGVIDSREFLADVLVSLLRDLRAEGLPLAAGVESPIRGRGGNREFFLFVDDRPGTEARSPETMAAALVGF